MKRLRLSILTLAVLLIVRGLPAAEPLMLVTEEELQASMAAPEPLFPRFTPEPDAPRILVETPKLNAALPSPIAMKLRFRRPMARRSGQRPSRCVTGLFGSTSPPGSPVRPPSLRTGWKSPKPPFRRVSTRSSSPWKMPRDDSMSANFSSKSSDSRIEVCVLPRRYLTRNFFSR